MFSKKYDIIFFCSSRIDEIWVRSTALCLSKFKVKIAILFYNPRKEKLPEIYKNYPIKIISTDNLNSTKKYKADIIVSASTNIRKSFFSQSIKHFIHMPHSLVSLHGVYPENAFDAFDILFACTPFHIEEFKAISKIQNIANPRIFRTGYGKLDILLADSPPYQEKKHVLIAPSWGDRNILETTGYDLILLLLKEGYKVTLRPHPMFYLEKKEVLEPFLQIEHPGFQIEEFLESTAIYLADTLVTDYSGIALEYLALGTNQRAVFVNTPPKILNLKIDLHDLPLFEVEKRQQFGLVVENNPQTIFNVLHEQSDWPSYRVDFIYNPGICGMIASHQLMDILKS